MKICLFFICLLFSSVFSYSSDDDLDERKGYPKNLCPSFDDFNISEEQSYYPKDPQQSSKTAGKKKQSKQSDLERGNSINNTSYYSSQNLTQGSIVHSSCFLVDLGKIYQNGTIGNEQQDQILDSNSQKILLDKINSLEQQNTTLKQKNRKQKKYIGQLEEEIIMRNNSISNRTELLKQSLIRECQKNMALRQKIFELEKQNKRLEKYLKTPPLSNTSKKVSST